MKRSQKKTTALTREKADLYGQNIWDISINLWKILVDLGEIFDLAHKYFKTKFTVNE